MRAALHEGLAHKLEGLRRRLLERLPELLAEIESACRASLAAPGDAARFERAVHASHTMAGTAGTYGFIEIGDISRDLELIFRVAPPPPAREVEALLGRLRELLPQAQASGSRTLL